MAPRFAKKRSRPAIRSIPPSPDGGGLQAKKQKQKQKQTQTQAQQTQKQAQNVNKQSADQPFFLINGEVGRNLHGSSTLADPDDSVRPSPASCALCAGSAAVFCAADGASLCWDCDSLIHSANFLVARHARSFLCSACAAMAPHTGTGPHLAPRRLFCSACLTLNPNLPSLTFSSSATITTTTTISASSSSSSSNLSHNHDCSSHHRSLKAMALPTFPSSSEGAGDSQEDDFSTILLLKLLPTTIT